MGGSSILAAVVEGRAEAKGEGAPQALSGDAVQLTWKPKARLRLKLYSLLMGFDILCLVLSFLVAVRVRFGDLSIGQNTTVLAIVVPVFLALAINGKAYSIDVLRSPRVSARRATQALLLSAAIVTGLLFLLKVGSNYSRLILALGTAFSLISIASVRAIVGKWVGEWNNWTFANEALLVDGVPVFPARGQVVIFADQARLSPTDNDPIMRNRIACLFENCTRIVLACRPERRARWTSLLKGMNIDLEIIAPELTSLGALEMRTFRDWSTILVNCGPLDWPDRILKRGLDILLSVIALVILAPVLIMVAVAIKVDSSGPIFFWQQRVGYNNRIFKVLKFRTMFTQTCDLDGHVSASPSDARVTKIGRLLRRSSIDELPQLFNVLKGEMSIVGPRPHALASRAGEALFWDVDQRYFSRHCVMPGLTGLAQVRGFRGATDTPRDLTDRLQADLEYLSGWTIWRDLAIIFRTFRVLVHSRAY